MSSKQPPLIAIRTFTAQGPSALPEGSFIPTYTGMALVRPVRENATKFPSGPYAETLLKIAVFEDATPGFYQLMADGRYTKIGSSEKANNITRVFPGDFYVMN